LREQGVVFGSTIDAGEFPYSGVKRSYRLRGLRGPKPSGRAISGAERVRWHRRRHGRASGVGSDAPLVPSAPPPGDDFAERQGAINACDELVQQLRAITATLMPPTAKTANPGCGTDWVSSARLASSSAIARRSRTSCADGIIHPSDQAKFPRTNVGIGCPSTFQCAFDFLVGRRHDLDPLCP
jgi:hypothetical protein